MLAANTASSHPCLMGDSFEALKVKSWRGLASSVLFKSKSHTPDNLHPADNSAPAVGDS